MEIKETIENNKEIIKRIQEFDEVYCNNISDISRLQAENLKIKTKCCNLRTKIRQIRVYRTPKLTTEEKRVIIEKVGKCNKCPDINNLTVHHKNTLSQGGTNEDENLEVLCLKCHRKHHPINYTAIKHGEIIPK